MMKKIFLTPMLVFTTMLFVNAASPNNLPSILPDSKYGKTEVFKSSKIKKGINYYYYRFKTLYGVPLSFSILKIDWTPATEFGITTCGKKRKPVYEMAKKVGATAAVNGTNFFFSKPVIPSHSLKINGKAIIIHSQWITPLHGYFAFSPSKFPEIGKHSIKKHFPRFDNYLQASYLLLINSKKPKGLSKRAISKNNHPRMAVGINKKKKQIFFIAIDGRNKEYPGLSLSNTAEIFKDLGCENALNLDGGGSATMYITGKPFNGIVNYPCDNKKFDHNGSRRVYAAIYVR